MLELVFVSTVELCLQWVRMEIWSSPIGIPPESSRWTQPQASVVAIDSSNKKVHEIAQGADFYNHPQFTPQGDRVCWIQWNFPDMPWTGTTLSSADGKMEILKIQAVLQDNQVWRA
ncbi:hypothetical protein MMC22_005417 [Lobaria immixta]|nr:hypothetical protein [Lobaria immixta]